MSEASESSNVIYIDHDRFPMSEDDHMEHRRLVNKDRGESMSEVVLHYTGTRIGSTPYLDVMERLRSIAASKLYDAFFTTNQLLNVLICKLAREKRALRMNYPRFELAVLCANRLDVFEFYRKEAIIPYRVINIDDDVSGLCESAERFVSFNGYISPVLGDCSADFEGRFESRTQFLRKIFQARRSYVAAKSFRSFAGLYLQTSANWQLQDNNFLIFPGAYFQDEGEGIDPDTMDVSAVYRKIEVKALICDCFKCSYPPVEIYRDLEAEKYKILDDDEFLVYQITETFDRHVGQLTERGLTHGYVSILYVWDGTKLMLIDVRLCPTGVERDMMFRLLGCRKGNIFQSYIDIVTGKGASFPMFEGGSVFGAKLFLDDLAMESTTDPNDDDDDVGLSPLEYILKKVRAHKKLSGRSVHLFAKASNHDRAQIAIKDTVTMLIRGAEEDVDAVMYVTPVSIESMSRLELRPVSVMICLDCDDLCFRHTVHLVFMQSERKKVPAIEDTMSHAFDDDDQSTLKSKN